MSALADALACANQRCDCHRGRVTHCPAHQDGKPSMSLTERDGTTLFKCHAGCDQKSVVTALTERGLWPLGENITPISRGGSREPDHTYRYIDADGQLIAEHGRWNNPKSFAWRRPDGTWRDGLGDLGIESLPLYNLHAVLDNPEKLVFIVEGEKAVEACRNRGLIAVCLGGGAGQQRFGNALDHLKDREIVIWPDNDDQGRTFAARLRSLLPQSREVNPVVPEKGDAFDYFEAGGTITGIGELLREMQPRATMPDHTTVVVDYPISGGKIILTFSGLSSGRREVNARLRVEVHHPAHHRDDYTTRLNLWSQSGRESVRREIQNIYPGKDIEWARVLSTACKIAEDTWRSTDTSTDLTEIDAPEDVPHLIDGVMPENVATILFGPGGGGKSYLTLDIALHALTGEPWMGRETKQVNSVLVIDYEDRGEEWKRRAWQICRGKGWPFPAGLRYMPGRAIPVADQLDQILATVKKYDVGLLIIDSAASACGGALLDVTAVSALTNAMSDLGNYGVTSLLIAHTVKPDNEKSMAWTHHPWGVVFWTNLVRATWFVEANQGEGSSVLTAGIYNRKANRGLSRPIWARMEWGDRSDGFSLRIENLSHEPGVLMTEDRSLRWKIVEFLIAPMTVQQIAENLGAEPERVTKVLTDNQQWFLKVGKEGPANLWAVRSDREDQSA